MFNDHVKIENIFLFPNNFQKNFKYSSDDLKSLVSDLKIFRFFPIFTPLNKSFV
jgi:hypothetical protein